jgi:lauroyl/myristoyl acyltransferase
MGAAQALVTGLEALAPRAPSLGLRLAGVAAVALGPRLGDALWPAGAELEALLGRDAVDDLRALQRRIAASELRNRLVLRVLARRGPAPLAARIRLRGVEVLRALHDAKRPTVLLWWHQGVARAVETALPALGLPAFVATNAPRGPDAGYRWQVVVDDPGAGTRFLVESLRELKRGVVPVLSVDTPAQQAPRLPFFTGSLPLATGAAWLAARAQARLVPATSRWTGLGAGVEVIFHDPVALPERGERAFEAWEREVLASAARWYEDHLRRHPEELSLAQVRQIRTQRGGARSKNPRSDNTPGDLDVPGP